MKKLILFAAFLLSNMCFFSCGESEQKAKKESESSSFVALSQPGKQMKAANKKAEAEETIYQQKLRGRREKGDTVALHYKELQKYFPTGIDGYKAQEPSGGTVTATGMSYSNAEIRFKKENGDYIRISLLDYNAAYNLYSMTTKMWGITMSMENENEKAGTIKFDNGIDGWESFQKKKHKASVVLGIGYRFLLTIDANNQEDAEFVKSIASSMKLEGLAKM